MNVSIVVLMITVPCVYVCVADVDQKARITRCIVSS